MTRTATEAVTTGAATELAVGLGDAVNGDSTMSFPVTVTFGDSGITEDWGITISDTAGLATAVSITATEATFNIAFDYLTSGEIEKPFTINFTAPSSGADSAASVNTAPVGQKTDTLSGDFIMTDAPSAMMNAAYNGAITASKDTTTNRIAFTCPNGLSIMKPTVQGATLSYNDFGPKITVKGLSQRIAYIYIWKWQ